MRVYRTGHWTGIQVSDWDWGHSADEKVSLIDPSKEAPYGKSLPPLL
jgi:hypothetical protein